MTSISSIGRSRFHPSTIVFVQTENINTRSSLLPDNLPDNPQINPRLLSNLLDCQPCLK